MGMHTPLETPQLMLFYTMIKKSYSTLPVPVCQLAERWADVEEALQDLQNQLQVIHNSIYEYARSVQGRPERLVRPEKGILAYSYETWQELSVLVGYAQRAKESCRYLVDQDLLNVRSFRDIAQLDANWASLVQMGKEVRHVG